MAKITIDLTDLARTLAQRLGDDYDAAPVSKRDWASKRNNRPFRDINQPFKCDYEDAIIELLNKIGTSLIQSGTFRDS
jgi:hypothetical protein